MRNSTIAGLLAFSLFALPGFAQQSPVTSQSLASEPGKAVLKKTFNASVLVTAIDKARRTLTLKDAEGKSFTVVAGDEVKNFPKIKVNDMIEVEYQQALSLELRKQGEMHETTLTTGSARSKPGETPAGAEGRLVTTVADVIDVNPENKTITLKGPKGNVVVLDVKNPDQFKVVKTGDHVDVQYYEAVAIGLKPAPKKGAKK